MDDLMMFLFFGGLSFISIFIYSACIERKTSIEDSFGMALVAGILCPFGGFVIAVPLFVLIITAFVTWPFRGHLAWGKKETGGK